MRVLFVADGRSPIALNWIRYFVEHGDDVYLASTFACTPDLSLRGLEITPVAYSGRQKSTVPSEGASSQGLQVRTVLRHLLGPLTIRRAAVKLRAYATQVAPELVHAMRIPFEGMMAADAYGEAPLAVSVWGNDFTLHAPSNALMRHYTSWTMQVADALHADCRRDIRLSREWGFSASKPTLVAPGAGGIRTDIFYPPKQPVHEPVVINPRGSRAYVRNDVFFRAIPTVLAKHPGAKFLCVALSADRRAARLIESLGIGHAVTMLPQLSQPQLAELFRSAPIIVSPSVHDGTPNSLLEAMACGCFPVAGDLESIREWITHGENGLLVDATDPAQLADALIVAMENSSLRHDAAGLNQELIRQRAEYSRCMEMARDFYRRVIATSAPPVSTRTAH